MDQLLQQIVAGLEAGSAYALIGMAIVVIMKSTDVPNFAMAEMGLVAAYLTWWLSNEDKVGWPFGVAVVIGLVFAAVFGAFIEFFLVRPLTGSSTLPVAVLSAVGLGGSLIYLFDSKGLPGFLDWVPGAEGGFPLGVAIVLGVAAVPLTFWFMYRAVKRLDVVDHFPLLLLTIGLGFSLGSVIEILFGAGAQKFDAPWSGTTFDVGETRIGWDQVISISMGIIIALGLAAFFRSKWGVRMRAIAEDGTTARLLGINAGRVSLIAWGIGTMVAAAAMTLHTTSTVLELGSAQGLILNGFIAAVLGGFVSLPGTFAGGLFLGVAQTIVGGQISSSLEATIALLIVVVAMMIMPGGFTRQAKLREV